MSFYIVTGKLGNGKTLSAVSRIKLYLAQGRRVATNLDINVENFKNINNRTMDMMRLPDKPTGDNMWSIGRGHDQDCYDESKNGLLVLDECGTWFNSRGWNDPLRKDLNDWFRHARKLRWDVILIIQDISVLDSQARDSFAEHTVYCRRWDRFRIPLLGKITKLLGHEVRPPKIHMCVVKYGDTRQHSTVDTWWFNGSDLYDLYNTEQIYSDTQDGVYSYLTPWHLVGRYQTRKDWIYYGNKYLLPVIRFYCYVPILLFSKVCPPAKGGRPCKTGHPARLY